MHRASSDAAVYGLAATQHGVVARWQCLEAGMSGSALDRRRSHEGWTTLHRGVYLARPDLVDQLTGLHAAVLAVGPEGWAAGRSAAHLHEFEGFGEPRRPEVLRAGRRAPILVDVLVRTSCHSPQRSEVVEAVPVTAVERTVVDVARYVTRDQLTLVVTDLLARRRLDLRRLIDTVDRLGRPPGAVAVRDVVEEVRTPQRTESVAEQRFLTLLGGAGLPEPVAQFPLRDGRGRLLARIDFAYPDRRLAIEIDGFRYHATPAQKAADDRRQNAIVAAGWDVLRFSATELEHHARRVLATLREMLEAPAPPEH